MTTVVSWISKERETPTLWTITDSLLCTSSQSNPSKPLFECGAKLFSIRIVCLSPNENGRFTDKIYYSTTIGMAFAGSSLLALNLYSLVNYTLSTLASLDNSIPSIEEIAKHIFACFKALLESYIKTNTYSHSCEISIFGYCTKSKDYRLFHIKHLGSGPDCLFNEVKFVNDNTLHIMGNHQKEIRELINFERNKLNKKAYWRQPIKIIEDIIKKKEFPEIGGNIQLGISFPNGFRFKALYDLNEIALLFGQRNPKLYYQGVNLYSEPLLTQIGNCFVNTHPILKE